MKKRRNLIRCALTATLCLAVTLLTCACAAENIADSAATAESNTTPNGIVSPTTGAGTGTIEGATEQSGIVLEPIKPINPEERETELELLFSFETGLDGLFQYSFFVGEDGDMSTPSVGAPGTSPCADDKGNIYIDIGTKIIRLNDGVYLPFQLEYAVVDMLVCGERFYISTIDGVVRQFSLANGFENATLENEYALTEKYSFASLVDIGAAEPIWKSEEGKLYTLDKNEIPAEKLPFSVSSEISASDVMVSATGGYYLSEQSENGDYKSVVSASSNGIGIREGKINNSEELYSFYDAGGNIVSKFLFKREEGRASCEIPYRIGGSPVYVATECASDTFYIGNNVLTDVLTSYLIYGENNTLYLAVYYPNHGEVYRITPGYSDAELTAEPTDEQTEAGESIAPMSSTSDASVATSEEIWLVSNRAAAKLNAYVFCMAYRHVFSFSCI